jgi:type 1 fimbriae regulatory protein FimB/type 1 fimbriae regulatory protein FimE
MAKGNLRLASSRALNGTVPPRRKPNADLRTREYLDEFEVERLMRAAKANRNGQRDSTMILIAFRHGLRAAELVDLRWDQVDLGRNACLHVRRVKNGMPSVHPLQGDEMRALRELKRSTDSSFVFVSERGAPFTRAGFRRGEIDRMFKTVSARLAEPYVPNTALGPMLRPFWCIAPLRTLDDWSVSHRDLSQSPTPTS